MSEPSAQENTEQDAVQNAQQDAEQTPQQNGVQATADLEQTVDAYIDQVWDSLLADIAQLVSYDSVVDTSAAEPGKPYGPKAYEALHAATQIAARLGLETHELDGHLAFGDLPGERSEYLATIAHSDVVPAGPGWKADPFTMRTRDGYILGRGVMDDKGPLLLSLYTAHFFVEQVKRTGKKLPYTLRAIIGGDEEVGMTDVEYYLQRYPEPAFLFTPDAFYPVGVGEKGLFCTTFVSPRLAADSHIVHFEGGTAHNAVPGIATATVKGLLSQFPELDGIDREDLVDGTVKLTAHGLGGHASMPEGTKNAIGLLASYLLQTGVPSAAEAPFFELLGRIHASTDGSSLGISDADQHFGKPTCIGGTMRTVDGHLEQSIDSRFTTALTGAEITRRMEELAKHYGASIKDTGVTEPYLTDPDSAPVQVMMDVYRRVTGEEAQPFTMGGGTYARHFAHAVSFGPGAREPHDPDWVGMEHGPEEGISIQTLKTALKIYILTVHELMQLDYHW